MQDAEKAWLFARRGRQLSEIEERLYHYFLFYDDQLKFIAGQESRWEKWIKAYHAMKHLGEPFRPGFMLDFFEEFCRRHSSALIKIFMDSINSRDFEKIVEIANAVKFIKSFEDKRGDLFRAEILFHKLWLDKKGIKWPIRKVAGKIGWPDKVGADGFKQLRRMCKELNFPLAESKHKANKT